MLLLVTKCDQKCYYYFMKHPLTNTDFIVNREVNIPITHIYLPEFTDCWNFITAPV